MNEKLKGKICRAGTCIIDSPRNEHKVSSFSSVIQLDMGGEIRIIWKLILDFKYILNISPTIC